jgi:IclR family acetate operon transcriptional repressor
MADGVPTRIQSVARASQILVQVATTSGGLTANEVAARLTLSLASEGLLAKDRGSHYVLGPVAGVIGDAAARDLGAPELWVDGLRKLVVITGETAYLSAFRADELKVLFCVEGTHTVRVTGMTVGYAQYVHARSSGRLLLAHDRPEIRSARLGARRLRALTPSTITSRRQLDEDAALIRRDGIAIGRDDYVDGMTSASAPIIEAGTIVAAVTLAVPSHRFLAREARLVAELRRCARGIGRPTEGRGRVAARSS